MIFDASYPEEHGSLRKLNRADDFDACYPEEHGSLRKLNSADDF
jgi:hypothetical protein